MLLTTIVCLLYNIAYLRLTRGYSAAALDVAPTIPWSLDPQLEAPSD